MLLRNRCIGTRIDPAVCSGMFTELLLARDDGSNNFSWFSLVSSSSLVEGDASSNRILSIDCMLKVSIDPRVELLRRAICCRGGWLADCAI